MNARNLRLVQESFDRLRLQDGVLADTFARELSHVAAGEMTPEQQHDLFEVIAVAVPSLGVAEHSQIGNRVAPIKANRDFLARQAALDRVEKASPAVTKYVEFFLAFLIAVDLVALMLKLTHLFSTGGAYERSAAALRANDLVEVHRLQERANVLTRRITLQSQALQDADELRIRGEISREPEPEGDQLALDEHLSRRPPLGGPAPAPLGD